MREPSKNRALPSYTPDRPLTDSGQALDGWMGRSSSSSARGPKPAKAGGRSDMRSGSYLVQKQGQIAAVTSGTTGSASTQANEAIILDQR